MFTLFTIQETAPRLGQQTNLLTRPLTIMERGRSPVYPLEVNFSNSVRKTMMSGAGSASSSPAQPAKATTDPDGTIGASGATPPTDTNGNILSNKGRVSVLGVLTAAFFGAAGLSIYHEENWGAIATIMKYAGTAMGLTTILLLAAEVLLTPNGNEAMSNMSVL